MYSAYLPFEFWYRIKKRLNIKFTFVLVDIARTILSFVEQVTSVPLRYLAPETSDTLHCKRPTYNTKTDAWSYAITLWEMYSKGEICNCILLEMLSQGDFTLILYKKSKEVGGPAGRMLDWTTNQEVLG